MLQRSARSAMTVALGGAPRGCGPDRAQRVLHAVVMAAINLSPAGFPMAPSREVWDSLTADERARVVDALPGKVTEADIARLEQMLDQVQQRAEEESRRREDAEREVARLREELARLKR
jgi:hypothetical protein